MTIMLESLMREALREIKWLAAGQILLVVNGSLSDGDKGAELICHVPCICVAAWWHSR
jgi:hypothetical protein